MNAFQSKSLRILHIILCSLLACVTLKGLANQNETLKPQQLDPAQPVLQVPFFTQLKNLKALSPEIQKQQLMGGVNGGGGTSVMRPNSSKLVLWDLFTVWPFITDEQSGDQIDASPKNLQIVDYQNFQSYKLLQEKLNLIQFIFPHLYQMLTNQNYKPSLVIVDSFPQKLQEIFVDERSKQLVERMIPDAHLFPVAHFDVATRTAYVSRQLWNHLGLRSQAALLLHENLRVIQQNSRRLISNEWIQNLVGNIVGTPYGMDLNAENFTVAAGYLSMIFQDHAFQLHPLVMSPADQDSVEKRFSELEKEGLFAQEPVKFNPGFSLGAANSRVTLANETVLDSSSCNDLLNGGFSSDTNTFRWPLRCHNGILGGVGSLQFETPQANILSFGIKGNLYSPNDGGSEFGWLLNNKETGQRITVRLANRGTRIMTWINFNETSIPVTHAPLPAAKMRFYQVVLNQITQELTIHFKDNEADEWSTLTKVKIAGFSSSDQPLFRWKFFIFNNSVIETIKVNSTN